MSVLPPRHLAPTVGLATSGAMFCAGPHSGGSDRLVTGMVLPVGSIGCLLGDPKDFVGLSSSRKASVVAFGDFHVLIAVIPEKYP